MTEKNSETGQRLKLPFKTIMFSILVLLTVFVARTFKDWLHLTFNLANDELNVISTLALLVVFLSWSIWWFVFSGVSWKLKTASLLVFGGLIYGAYRTIKVIPGGDAGIARIEFLFLQKELETEVAADAIDLTQTSALDFPGFRGKDRSGVVEDIALQDWIDVAPKLVWKKDVGKGWSAFSAVNGFAVTMEQRQEFECVTCYEVATGELRWIRKNKTRHEDAPGLGGAGPRSTPTIHNGRVYTQGATGLLECLDGADGSLIWKVNIPGMLDTSLNTSTDAAGYEFSYETNTLAWGRACSPLIYEDKVIVTAGGPVDGPFVSLIAFDAETGDEIWRGGDEMIAYGSPSVGKVLGSDQILVVCESVASGHDPKTGKTLWTHRRPGGSASDANTSQVTCVSDDELLLTKGYRRGGELVRLKTSAEDSEFPIDVERVWKSNRVLKTKFNSPVVKDGYAYSISAGYLECCELKTGKQMWLHPDWKSGETGDRVDQGQLLLVGNRLVVMSEKGVLYLVEADPTAYRQIGKLPALNGVCWNNLCLHGDKLLVRSDIEAACFELPIKRDVESRQDNEDQKKGSSGVAKSDGGRSAANPQTVSQQ